MSEIPPSYAPYPRTESSYGTADQLQSLVDGYYGLGRAFALNVLCGFLIGIASGLAGKDNAMIVYVTGLLVLAMIIGCASYPLTRKIAFGANWPASRAVVASFLMGLNSFTCGIVGYIVMQQITMNHIKKYGVRPGVFGLKVSDLARAIADRLVNERAKQTI